MKQCAKCGIKQTVLNFYPRTDDKNKYMAECKSCANSRTRKNYRSTRETKYGHAFQIFSTRKREAKRKGIIFEVSFEYVFSLDSDICPILNIPLSWCQSTKTPQNNSPSIDKIIPEKGYVEGNVCWVSFRANTIKGNGNLDEHLAITEYIKSALLKNK